MRDVRTYVTSVAVVLLNGKKARKGGRGLCNISVCDWEARTRWVSVIYIFSRVRGSFCFMS